MFESFLFFLITTVAQILLTPKQKFEAPRASALGDFQFPTAEYGRAVSIPYGEVYVKGPNTTWFGDLKTVPIVKHQDGGWFSSGTNYTVGYRYYMGAHLVFCTGLSEWELQHGSGLVELRFDDKTPVQTRTEHTTDATANYTTIALNSPSLFGGDEAEGGVSGNVDFYYGVYNQPANNYMAAAWFAESHPGAQGVEPIPAYRGFCSAIFNSTYWGTSNYIKPVGAVIRRFPWPWPDLATGYNINNNANPAAIIVDLLTNSAYGVGLPEAVIGASFKDAAIKLADEQFGLSILIDSNTTARDAILEVIRHIDAVIYTDPVSKKIEIKLVRADYNIDDLLSLNESNIVSLKLTRTTITDTKNVVKVKYTNKSNNYQTDVVEYQNTANINATGRKLEDTYEFRGITDAATAAKAATRILKTVSEPLAVLSLTVNRAALQLTPGSVFKLSWENYGISNMACRVTKINYGDLSEPTITIDAVEDVFGTLATSFSTPPGSDWVDPSIVQLLPQDTRLIEAPYHIIGSTDRKVLTLCSRSSDIQLGYKVITSQDAINYTQNYVSPVFTPHAVLDGNYNERLYLDTTGIHIKYLSDLTLLTSTMLPGQTGADIGRNIMLIDNEYIGFYGITPYQDGYQVTGLLRGLFGSVPAPHYSGAKVWFPAAGTGMASTNAYLDDLTLYAKMLPFTASAELPPENALVTTLHTTSSALKPYPPSVLLVNGSYNTTSITDHADAVVTWSHRNKQSQLAAGQVVGHFDVIQIPGSTDVGNHFTPNSPIAKPSDVSYYARVFINNVLVHTEWSSTNMFTYHYNKYVQDASGVVDPVVVIKIFANRSGGTLGGPSAPFMSATVETLPFTMS